MNSPLYGCTVVAMKAVAGFVVAVLIAIGVGVGIVGPLPALTGTLVGTFDNGAGTPVMGTVYLVPVRTWEIHSQPRGWVAYAPLTAPVNWPSYSAYSIGTRSGGDFSAQVRPGEYGVIGISVSEGGVAFPCSGGEVRVTAGSTALVRLDCLSINAYSQYEETG